MSFKSLGCIAIFLFIFTNTFGLNKHRLKGKPTTLEETFVYLDQIFDDTAKYGYITLPEDVAIGRIRWYSDDWMRNGWGGIWWKSKLYRYFLKKGLFSIEDMSDVILTSYYRHLKNLPIELDGQIEKILSFYRHEKIDGDTIKLDTNFLKDFNKNRTSDSILMNYFPTGDTILVSIYASYKKMLRTFASNVRAMGIVKEHLKNKLLIQFIDIKNEKGKKAERKIGDIHEESPRYCSLLPPKNWSPTVK